MTQSFDLGCELECELALILKQMNRPGNIDPDGIWCLKRNWRAKPQSGFCDMLQSRIHSRAGQGVDEQALDAGTGLTDGLPGANPQLMSHAIDGINLGLGLQLGLHS